MPDEDKIWISGRKIRSAAINKKEMQLEGNPDSTVRAFTPPHNLDDGPVEIEITLSDNTKKTLTHEYRKEGINHIILKGIREIEVKVTGSEIVIGSVKIQGINMPIRRDSVSTWTVTLSDDLDNGPWPMLIIPHDTGDTRKSWKFDYEYRKEEEGKNQIIIVHEPPKNDEAATAGHRRQRSS
jgi:hypothetical protein